MTERTGTPADFELDPRFPLLHELESPTEETLPVAYAVALRGWVLVPPGATVDSIRVEHGGRVELARRERPDVELAFGGPQAVGFQQLVPVGSGAHVPWELVVGFDGVEYRTPIPHVRVMPDAHEEMLASKRAKLARLEPVLRCPAPAVDGGACGDVLERDGVELRCTRCGTRYQATERSFDFLSGELSTLANVTATDNVSNHGYDEIAEEILRDCADGLVLDNGSGYKDLYRDNVVNLEIADYETTDVLGVGEALPFADDTFDAVLSLAVLEHVRDPFRCAAEIVRVVKPGGRVYAAVPFLQPYHGYPSHYYNMTLQGLENLWGGCTIERSGTPRYGLPIWTLCWFLSSYVDGLPSALAERFARMPVADFLRDAKELLDHDFVQELSADANHDLASVNYVVATKDSRPESSIS